MRIGCGLLATLAFGACSSPAPKGDHASGSTPAGVTAAKVSAPTHPTATLTPVKWPQLDAAIASHRGHVVVVDVWADY
jgi:hypothetical protein